MIKNIAVGEKIVGPSHNMDHHTLMEFENVIWRRGLNVHSDPEAAKESGMDRMIASGQNQLAVLHEMLETQFGEGWTKGGQIAVRWIRPVYVDDTINSFAEVTEFAEAEGKKQVLLNVWCENQDGQKTGVGTARAYLR